MYNVRRHWGDGQAGGWVGRVGNLCMNICSGINCDGTARTFAID
jgi:hypothetical protein